MTDSMKESDLLVPVSLLSHRRPGAIVTVKGDDGREYRGRIVAVEGETARVRTFEELRFSTESPLEMTLIQALPKKERMESIIHRATELGVKTIIPCVSARSVDLTPGPGAGQDKSHRWPAVALKAVEQCRRRSVPAIVPCPGLREAFDLTGDKPGLKLIFYEKEKNMCLKSALSALPDRVTLACGPEGGFTEEEILLARGKGFLPVGLGDRIMRCETAVISVLAIMQYLLGDLAYPGLARPAPASRL